MINFSTYSPHNQMINFINRLPLQIIGNYILNLTIISSMAKGKKGKNKEPVANAANQVAEPTKVQSNPSDTISQTSTQVGTENTMAQEKREVGQEEFSQNSSNKLQEEAKREEIVEQPPKIAQVDEVGPVNVEANPVQALPIKNEIQQKLEEPFNKPLVDEVVEITENVNQAQPQRMLQKVQEMTAKQENIIQRQENSENQRIPESKSELEHKREDLIEVVEDTNNAKIDQTLDQPILSAEEKDLTKKEEEFPVNREELVQEIQPTIQKVQQRNIEIQQKIQNPTEQSSVPHISHQVQVQKPNIHESSETVILAESQTIQETKKQEILVEEQRAHSIEFNQSQNISILKEQTVQLSPVETVDKHQRQAENSKPTEQNSDDVEIDLSKPIDEKSFSAANVQKPVFIMVDSQDIQSESQQEENKSQVIREIEKEVKIEASQSFSDLNYSVERDQIDPTRSHPVNISPYQIEELQNKIIQERHFIQNQVNTDQKQEIVQAKITPEETKIQVEHTHIQALKTQNYHQPIIEHRKEQVLNNIQETIQHVKIIEQQAISEQEHIERIHTQTSNITRREEQVVQNLTAQKAQVLEENRIKEKDEISGIQKIESLVKEVENNIQPKNQDQISLLKNDGLREEEKNYIIQEQKKEEAKEQPRREQIKEQNEVKEQSKIEVIVQSLQQAVEIKVEALQQVCEVAVVQQPKVEQEKVENIQEPKKVQPQFQLVQDKIQSNSKQELGKDIGHLPVEEQLKINKPKESKKPDDKKNKDQFGKILISVGLGAVLGGCTWAFQKNPLRSALVGVGTTAIAYLFS